MAYNHEYPYTDPYRGNADWLLNKVKEFAATLDSWQETIDELIAALEQLDGFDKRIVALENATKDLPTIRLEIASLIESAESQELELSELREKIEKINNYYKEIFALYNDLIGVIDDNKLYLMSLINAESLELKGLMNTLNLVLQGQIDDIMRRLDELDPQDVYNPVEASRFSLDKNNELVYAQLRDLGLTNGEYSELNLTNDEYAAYKLSNRQYASEGKKWLHWFKYFSPISGIKMTIENALSDVATFILNSLTNDEYAALDLTNDAYEALDLTNIQRLTYRP